MRFTIYSKYGCSYCKQIKLLFELNEFKFVELHLDRDFDKNQFYELFGEGSTFPQVILNDKISLGGCTETVKYLQKEQICCNV
jgi:glutaredoxin